MNRYIIKIITFILCLTIPALAFSQKNKKDLENKKKKIQEDIAYLNKLLEKTADKKEASLGQLMAVDKKISLHEELINTINKEIAIIEAQVNKGKDSIGVMQVRLADLKKEYARMIVDAYKTEKGYSKLMFIFASKDFDQAAMRMRYLQEYQEYRHKQALIIDSTSKELDNKVTRLEQKKLEKKELLESMQTEQEKLDVEKSEQQNIYKQMQGKEKALRRELADKQKATQKLDAEIHKLIENAIKESNNISRTANTKGKEMSLTPEAKALSDNFESNKGKLPWPVVEGLIYRPFGTYSPMPGITMTNNGIDIATTKSAIARAVFEGQVSIVTDDPTLGKVIIIRHGDYLSVYVHMKEVFVKAGEKIQTKQTLGTIQYDEQNEMADLELEIWKGQNKLDPQEWLYKKD